MQRSPRSNAYNARPRGPDPAAKTRNPKVTEGPMSAMPKGVEILAPIRKGYEKILTPDALKFVAALVRKHGKTREKLLAFRAERQAKIDAGKLPAFLPETKKVRSGKWQIAGIPADLQDRRVEITGPVDRKMIINALNSGAKCFM